ncbi:MULTISPECIES: heavy metal-associated domain-containing protein [unclassified Methanoculleus]|jgi:copper chaperone CopZ|uniref:Heavy metal-associated domain-containing protein n=2 Tax=Methanoculleus TaxID=45989 RepID=A0ABD8A7Y7_9EURY|nr:heavy metal-associated domain-containing protein [Methanoculleus palmolei]
MLIADAISEINGARVLSADHTSGAVIVDYDSEATLEAIRQAIRGEGFTV